MGKQLNELTELLLSSLVETLGVLSHLSDAELDDLSIISFAHWRNAATRVKGWNWI